MITEPKAMSHKEKCDAMQRELLNTVVQSWDAFKLHNNSFGPKDNTDNFCDGVEKVEDGIHRLMEENSP